VKDISEFKVGEIATSFMSKTPYEVMKFNWIIKRNKHIVESSTCTNLETGKEVIITWNKNKNFV